MDSPEQRHERRSPEALAKELNETVEDMQEQDKLSDLQYLTLQNIARDVFRLPYSSDSYRTARYLRRASVVNQREEERAAGITLRAERRLAETTQSRLDACTRMVEAEARLRQEKLHLDVLLCQLAALNSEIADVSIAQNQALLDQQEVLSRDGPSRLPPQKP